MKKKGQNPRQPLKLQNFLMLLVSGTVNALGVTMFLTPVGLYDSGISGTSMLLDQLTPTWRKKSSSLRNRKNPPQTAKHKNSAPRTQLIRDAVFMVGEVDIYRLVSLVSKVIIPMITPVTMKIPK